MLNKVRDHPGAERGWQKTFLLTLLLVAREGASHAALNVRGKTSLPPFSCPGGGLPERVPPSQSQSEYAYACISSRGMREGPYREYFRQGAMAAKGHYQTGKTDGQWTFYYGSGFPMSRGTLRAEKREGVWTSDYENGQRLAEGTYAAGQLDGPWKEWYENGQLKSEGAYRAGLQTGSWKFWFPNGRPDRGGLYSGTHRVLPQNTILPAESGKWTKATGGGF